MADKDFGNRLQAIRKMKNYTQQQLSDLLGLKNKTTLSSWEVGKSEPDIKSIKDLCNILKVDVNELFDFPQKTDTTSVTAAMIGHDGEKSYYGEDVNDKIGKILEGTNSKYYIADKKGHKIILNEKEYNILVNVLNTYRESVK